MPDVLECKQCGGAMTKTSKADRNMALQLVGVLVFIVGFVLVWFPPLGTIAGIILMLVSLRLGYSKRKVWRCHDCDYFFERA